LGGSGVRGRGRDGVGGGAIRVVRVIHAASLSEPALPVVATKFIVIIVSPANWSPSAVDKGPPPTPGIIAGVRKETTPQKSVWRRFAILRTKFRLGHFFHRVLMASGGGLLEWSH
jgi:hypothetical protein